MTTILKNYINGEWVNSKGKEALDVINPATGSSIMQVPAGSAGDIEDAAKADQAFTVLMGDEVAPRKKFIQSHATSAQLDI